MLSVRVTRADLRHAAELGSVWVVLGTAANGDVVTFVGDRRPMSELIEAVVYDGQATALVEAWQVLSRRPVPPEG